MLQDNPCALMFNAADGFVDRQITGGRFIPALTYTCCAFVEMQVVWPVRGGLRSESDQAVQIEERMMSQNVLEVEPALVEILAECLSFEFDYASCFTIH